LAWRAQRARGAIKKVSKPLASEAPIPAEWTTIGQPEALEWWENRHQELRGFDAVGYAGAGEAYNAWLYRVRRRLFRRHVAPLASAESSVLDVASGTGFYLDRWREAGVRRRIGSDVSPTAVQRLRVVFPDVRIERFDIAGPAAELPRERFDLVSAFDILFHLIDDDAYGRALDNLAALVRPGGLLVISENFRLEGPRRFASIQVNREEGEILAAFLGAGFELVSRHPMFVIMNAPARGGRPLLYAWWQRAHRLLMRRPSLGGALGAVLYPLELICVATVKRAPSSELAIFRRLHEPR
jgi:SAM-dependent methyltransferase